MDLYAQHSAAVELYHPIRQSRPSDQELLQDLDEVSLARRKPRSRPSGFGVCNQELFHNLVPLLATPRPISRLPWPRAGRPWDPEAHTTLYTGFDITLHFFYSAIPFATHRTARIYPLILHLMRAKKPRLAAP